MRGVLARVRGFVASLLRAHASPARLAAAVFVGVLVGCSPLFGLHLWVCLGLAWLLRLNAPTVYAAANISVPPLVPLLGFASVQLGERVRAGRWLPLSVADFRDPPGGLRDFALRFLVDWLLGGLLVGAAIGLSLAALVYLVARRRQLARDPIERALAEAARRYAKAKGVARGLREYARWKYRLDPVYRRLAALVPPGATAIDLGTGLGQLPILLALLDDKRQLLGVDWDEAKLLAARAAAEGLPGVRFVAGDARGFALPPADAIALVDVLHYDEPAAQRALLARCAAALGPRGLLLVRDGDGARSGFARLTRLLERLAVRLGWNRAREHGAGQTWFRGAGELRADLEALGLRVTVEPLAGPLHPGNVLLVAARDETDRATNASNPP